MADLPVVNALEEMDGQIKSQTVAQMDSISRLQSSIRQGLALNRAEIKASTSAILAVQATLAVAFNLNEEFLAIEKEKMRLEDERDRETKLKENQKQKKNKGFIAKVKGGLFDILKKVFYGTALIGAAKIVLENWDTIVETFEKIKPTLIAFKDGVVKVAKVVFPFLVDNFDTISKTFAVIVAGKTLLKAVVALKNGYLAVSSTLSAANTAVKGWKKSTGSYLKNVKKSVAATATAVVDMGKASVAWAKSKGAKLVKLIRGVVVATTTYATTMGKASLEWAKSKGAKLVKLIRAVVLATTLFATTTLAPALASLTAGLVAAAPFVLIAAAVALVLASLVNAIGDAKDKFEETGSIGEALKEGLKSLFANIIGLPIKLIKKVGQMMGLLDDPTAQIEETQSKLEEQKKASLENQKKIASYRQELGEARAQGMDEEAKMLEGILKSRMEDQKLLEKNMKNSQQELVDLKTSSDSDPVEKIKGFLNSLDPEAFLKNLLRSVLPVGNSLITKGLQAVIPDGLYDYAGIDKATGEAIAGAIQANSTQAGAEVDVRSREIAGQAMQPNITVAAPQTSIQTDNSTSVSKTSVASASPRRDKKPWWSGRNYASGSP